jgi:hypothetical protein
MACHDIGWVLSAHMRFGSLDFIVTVVLPFPIMDLDMVIETLEGLRLCPSESHALEHG